MPHRHQEEAAARSSECSAGETGQLHFVANPAKAFANNPHVVSGPKLACIIPNAQLLFIAMCAGTASPFGAPVTNAATFAVHSNLVEELHTPIVQTSKSASATEA